MSEQDFLAKAADLLDRLGELGHQAANRVRSKATDRARSELVGLFRSDPGEARKHDTNQAEPDPLGEPQPPRDGVADTVWLTKSEVAQRLGVSPQTIYRWGKTGHSGFPPPARWSHTKVVWPLAAIEDWEQSQRP